MRRLLLTSCTLALACNGPGREEKQKPDASPQNRNIEVPLDPEIELPLPDVKLENYADLGPRVNSKIVDGVAITEGVSRIRRRHENDMDFSKYNPFYWEGRLAFFKVEDFTPSGIKKIRFQLETEWPQDDTPNRGPDLSAYYTGNPTGSAETVRSKFALNQRMQHAADRRRFEYTISGDDIKTGELLVFEYRFFLDESHPLWQKEKDFNPHTQSAYYSEFLRIRVGEPGLLIDTLSDSTKLPDVKLFSGGWTTIPTVRVEPWKALQQQATNATKEEAQNFLSGRTFFHTDMKTGQHVDDRDDDKPLVFFEEMRKEREGYAGAAYNMTSCNGCHINNGIAMLPEVGQSAHAVLAKTLDSRTGETHASFGQQLQTQGPQAEGQLKLKGYATHTVSLDDGTVITLRKPEFKIESSKNQENLALSIRKPPAMIGIGLLDAIPEDTLKALAQRSKGEYRGRFGWKAQQPDVRAQIEAALNFDMGVTTSKRPDLDCGDSCGKGKAPLSEDAIDQIQSYVSLLGVPPRRNPSDPKVARGSEVFMQLGCPSCHVPVLKTGPSKFKELADQTIQPFTDLLLHDMGEGLADADGGPYARKWRTAPLWGLKNVKHSTDSLVDQFRPGNIEILFTDTMRAAENNPIQLLHDGRAESIPEAILWHGGQAEDSVRAYKALSKTDREALEAFLWDL